MIAMILSTFLHVALSLFFVIYLDYGLVGLAIANSIKDAVLCFITAIYGYCSERVRKVLVPYDMEALRGWKEYLSISIPATVMIISEWWAFELITLLAGMLGVI